MFEQLKYAYLLMPKDPYKEEHALEALKGYHSKESVDNAAIVQTHAGGLYNPSIPIAPPKVSEVKVH